MPTSEDLPPSVAAPRQVHQATTEVKAATAIPELRAGRGERDGLRGVTENSGGEGELT